VTTDLPDPDVEYGYRFYDGPACFGPLPRDTVLAKLRADYSAIPMERIQLPGALWTAWADSDDLLREVCP
jgi:hypothetical protein